jgi:hypothetical protein
MVGNDLISGKDALTSSPADTDELLISDAGVLKRIDVSLVGGKNTPAFEASLSSDQSISDATATKVQFNTETFDTDSAYDNSSNYRFTPQTAGKYFVYAKVQCDAQAAANLNQSQLYIYKNGSKHTQTQMNYNNNQPENVAAHINNIIDMNGSSDYLEIFIYIDDGSGSPQVRGTSSFVWTSFGAFKIIT